MLAAPLQTPPPLAEYRGLVVCVDGHRVYDLKVGFNTVGRLPENDVVLSGSGVSRRHCLLLVHEDRSCAVQDACSCNGTYVNGERITTLTRLHSGDAICVGTHRLVFTWAWDVTLSDDS
jgi:pSer/pThr/pTyr-binding forkhead associated (FHA) protein